MKACPDCQAARETNGLWARHCPTCLWCGARLIQRIGQLKRPQDELSTRRKAVLSDWLAMGHDEAKLRALVASEGMPVQPVVGKKANKRS